MAAVIGQVVDPAQMLAVGRLRYEVYVRDMGRYQTYADHDSQTVLEPLDDCSHVLAAWEDERVVGTVRSSLGCTSAKHAWSYYEELYGLRECGPYFPEHVSVTTKLIVAPDSRRSTLAPRLARQAYELGRSHCVYFDFIDCNAPLRPLFHRLGYREFSSPIVHPEYGEVFLQVLALFDYEHLRDVASPLLPRQPAARSSDAIAALRHFHTTFGKRVTTFDKLSLTINHA